MSAEKREYSVLRNLRSHDRTRRRAALPEGAASGVMRPWVGGLEDQGWANCVPMCQCVQSYSQIVIVLMYKWRTPHACLVHSSVLPGSLIIGQYSFSVWNDRV